MERYSFYTPELLGIIGAIVAVARNQSSNGEDLLN